MQKISPKSQAHDSCSTITKCSSKNLSLYSSELQKCLMIHHEISMKWQNMIDTGCIMILCAPDQRFKDIQRSTKIWVSF